MRNRNVILQQAEKYDSFYLYDESEILESIGRLKGDFPGVQFLYSLKTNSNSQVAASVLGAGLGADAASIGEVRRAVANGVPRNLILYSTPGKTSAELEEAMKLNVTLIADSFHEVEMIEEIASRLGRCEEIGIRINPAFGFYGGDGAASKFGIDEEQVLAAASWWQTMKHVRVRGIHVHLHSQELNADVLCRYHANVINLAKRVQSALGTCLGFINLGSGFGIPYAEDDVPMDIYKVGQAAVQLIDELHEEFPDIKIYAETGRYVVGKSGTYVTKVIDKKVSHGVTYVLLKNTLNGFVRPSMEYMVMQYAGQSDPAPCEPMFTKKGAFQFTPVKVKEPVNGGDCVVSETVTLCGILCTAADVMAKDITLPELEIGDLVAVNNAGSYAAVLSPMQFSSHEPPAQLLLTVDGRVVNAAVTGTVR